MSELVVRTIDEESEVITPEQEEYCRVMHEFLSHLRPPKKRTTKIRKPKRPTVPKQTSIPETTKIRKPKKVTVPKQTSILGKRRGKDESPSDQKSMLSNVDSNPHNAHSIESEMDKLQLDPEPFWGDTLNEDTRRDVQRKGGSHVG